MRESNRTAALLSGLLAGFMWASEGTAQTLSTEDILNSLENSASSTPLDVGAVQRALTNRIMVAPGSAQPQSQEIIPAHATSVSLQIFFDYDSADISADSVPQLVKLGLALQDPQLKGARFMVGGHTDARGDRRYNLELSQRRAESVRRFLLESFDLRSEYVAAIGFGEEQLSDQNDPEGSVNRRVQIVNLGQPQSGM